MSRARHKEHKRAEGGRLSSEPKWNAGGEQNAAKEAEEKKKGGRVHGEGEHSKHRADKRARGGHVKHHGKVEHEHHGKVEHEHKKHGGKVHQKEEHPAEELKHGGHAHKGRARGGRIGANLMPLSTAARVKHVTKGEEPEEGGPEGSKVANP